MLLPSPSLSVWYIRQLEVSSDLLIHDFHRDGDQSWKTSVINDNHIDSNNTTNNNKLHQLYYYT